MSDTMTIFLKLIPIFIAVILIVSLNILQITLIYKKEVNKMEENKIGTRLRKFRYSLDLTQQRLGEKADLHYSYIGQVERGDKTPSLKALIKIADALNISVEELIREDRGEGEEQETLGKFKLKNINQLLSDRSPEELDHIYKILTVILDLLDDYQEKEKIKENELEGEPDSDNTGN